MKPDLPIPEFSDPDFRALKIDECHEQVIRLCPTDRVRVYPAYHARGFATSDSSIYLRTGVIDALRAVSVTLKKGMSIVVYDGLRSLLTQKEIADRFAAALATAPISDEERSSTISRFVAPMPATEDEYRLAPPSHSTGGALDVGLASADGSIIDLGADFDQFDETAATTYYEKVCRRSTCSGIDRARRDQRRILYWAMTGAGFAPYPAEYWHFELGTKRAAAFFKQPAARYGAVAPWPREYVVVA